MSRVLLLAAFLAMMTAQLPAVDYRVDCADAKWRAIESINALVLKPADRLLLRAGCLWQGMLQPKGSGIEGHAISIDRYGEREAGHRWRWRPGGDASLQPAVLGYRQPG